MSSNKNIVLIMGPPASGKSISLRNLQYQEKKVYLNTDLKELPFKDSFAKNVEISDAMDVLGYIAEVEKADSIDGVVLDTITFLMSMYERQYVITSVDTQKAWGSYGNFYRDFIHAIKSGTKDYVIMAHETSELNETTSIMENKVPVKGAVGRTGVEADFTTILQSKRVMLRELEGFENDLLTITPEEEEDGFKYVFQTRVDKKSLGAKMRSALGLWSRKEKFIDNDIDLVFKRLHEYYS